MARISAPVQFSEHFGVAPEVLKKLGAFDPSLNVDTKLFIDPLLLPHSGQALFNDSAWKRYEGHFERIIALLMKANGANDPNWLAARRLLSFREVKWTCLGYGADGIAGAGSGKFLTDNMMQTAKQIIQLGIDDTELFLAFALFEDGIGPDRISDMTTNVVLPEIISFTEQISTQLRIPTRLTHLSTIGAGRVSAQLPVNPFANGPVLLVPADILRALPLAADWGAISQDAEARNVKDDVNFHIIELWQRKSKEAKADLKAEVLKDKESFQWLIDTIKSIDIDAYDFTLDPEFEVRWKEIGRRIVGEHAREIVPPKNYDKADLERVVLDVIEVFRFLIEDRRLSEELYLPSGKARTEKAAQRLFFAVAYSYCKANDIDITPEADTGNGPVDFKFSRGFQGRILIEIKLTKNPKLVAGYTKQVAKYALAEETDLARYLVIDVGNAGQKVEEIMAIRNDAVLEGRRTIPIDLVDGTRRASASLL
jgi:hypothetical protein